jgi:4-hydroxybenzoate polyprenyltransferase
MLDYFVFAANILIYGVNDIADGDTDQFNEKK